MSFKYNGSLVTINNYMETFEGYSVDFLDEVRLAALDDTPIGSIINASKDDPRLLGQLRKAIREHLPAKYVSVFLNGDCIYWVRQIHSKAPEKLCQIDRYLDKHSAPKLPLDTIEKLLKLISSGGDITKVDFERVADDCVDIFCEGLSKGYPMWLCITDGKPLTENLLRALMKGMSLGVDIHPFTTGEWSDRKIRLLLSKVKRVNFSSLLECVNPHFSEEELSIILDTAVAKADFKPLCLQDKDGYPVFNSYQMDALATAIRRGIPLDEIYNPRISDSDMLSYIEEYEQEKKAKGSRKLSGSFNK